MSVVNLNHAFVSAKADGADATRIRASNWNDELLFSGGALGDLLYRDTGSATGASWLAGVAAGAVLLSGGIGVAPAWSTILVEEAANIFAQRNGVNAQTMRVYGTYTDASNYERLEFGYNLVGGNEFEIRAVEAGTGAQRNIRIGGYNTGSSVSLTGGAVSFLTAIDGTAWYASNDAAAALGQVAKRWTTAYLSTSLVNDGYYEGTEIADPAAPASNKGRAYFRDNGSGKTEFVVRFPTGAVQVIKTEP